MKKTSGGSRKVLVLVLMCCWLILQTRRTTPWRDIKAFTSQKQLLQQEQQPQQLATTANLTTPNLLPIQTNTNDTKELVGPPKNKPPSPRAVSVSPNCIHGTSGKIFLHLGPYKTGTTSIQDYFTTHKAFLEKYNTTYLGKVNPNDFPPDKRKQLPKDFVRPLTQYQSEKGRQALRQYLQQTVVQKRHNVILSDESFNANVDWIVETFQGLPKVHITPIVVYRRYHERLVSDYHASFQPSWYQKSIWNRWNKGHSIPTFAQFIHGQIRQATPLVLRLLQSYVQRLEQNTKAVVCPHVLLLDHPQQESITYQFAKLVQNRRRDHSHNNNSNKTKNDVDDIPKMPGMHNVGTGKAFAVDSERLALFLWRQQSPANTIALQQQDRRTVVDKIQQFMNQLYNSKVNSNANTTTTATSSPIPWQCPPEYDMQLLWNQTRMLEERMGAENPTVSIRESFDSFVQQKRFCSLHLERMWQDPRWKTFVNQTLLGTKV